MMKSYDLFDLFAAWFTWTAKPRRFLAGKLQEAGFVLEHSLREKRRKRQRCTACAMYAAHRISYRMVRYKEEQDA